MGCTRDELARWLPGAVGGAPLRQDGPDAWVTEVAGGTVRIAVRELPPRRIALLALPVLAVQVRFAGLGEAEREAFLARFDLYTRRGGG